MLAGMPKLTPEALEVLTGPIRKQLRQLDATAEQLKAATTEEDRRRILTEARTTARRLANAVDEVAGYVNISTV